MSYVEARTQTHYDHFVVSSQMICHLEYSPQMANFGVSTSFARTDLLPLPLMLVSLKYCPILLDLHRQEHILYLIYFNHIGYFNITKI